MNMVAKQSKYWMVGLNIVIYSTLLAMMGSCAHFTNRSPISLHRHEKSNGNALLALQYNLINIERQDHSLLFRDSAGDLLEVEIQKETDTKNGLLVEIAENRTYQLEAISISNKTYLLKNLTQSFLSRPDKVNYLGSIQFEIRDSELVYSVLPPILSLSYLQNFLNDKQLKVEDLINPYTGKLMTKAFKMSHLNVINGNLQNSFSDYVSLLNPCYVKEWKKNPYILGELDFLVTEFNGVLRVKNQSSHHTGSEEFEQCVWNTVSASQINDTNFQLKLPGVLYF